jgi:hypothetical protein
MSKVRSSETKKPLLCSFCGKSQHEVHRAIAKAYNAARPVRLYSRETQAGVDSDPHCTRNPLVPQGQAMVQSTFHNDEDGAHTESKPYLRNAASAPF